MDSWTKPGFFFKPRFTRDGKNPADMVVLGARVFTCDDNRSRAQAVAVSNGLFRYVGDTKGALDFIGPDTTVVNARGRMLVPGFVDNHVHLLWMGMLKSIVADFYGCESFDELLSRISSHAQSNPDLPLVMGIGWMYDYIPGGMPDPAALEPLLPDRPVFLLSYEACTLWTNSAMHAIMQERNPTACRRMHPQIDEKTGEPTGLFLHSHSFNPLDFFSPEEFGKDTREKMLAGMAECVMGAVKAGVTTFDELQVYKSVAPLILELRDRGGLDDVRARLALYVDPIYLEDWDQLVKDLEWWKELGEKESCAHLGIGEAIKLYIDGVYSNHTGFMFEPYSDTEDDCGLAAWSQEDFDRVVELLDGMGMQACTHACGDAGIHRVLNSYQRTAEKNEPWDARHRVEHCELLPDEDMERIARFGFHAAMQPIHFYGDPSYERLIGTDRLQRYMPWRSLQDAGVEISCGTDWLGITRLPPINPMYGLVLMARRLNYKMKTDWGPGEKIEIEDAIYHYTMGGARALKMEDRIGSIEVGKYADFALFHTNLLKIASPWFLLTNSFEVGGIDDFVDMTVVGGNPVYTREGATF